MCVYVYIYIYIYMFICVCVCAHLRSDGYGQSPNQGSEFQRVRLKQNLDFEGWNSPARQEIPRKA